MVVKRARNADDSEGKQRGVEIQPIFRGGGLRHLI